MRQARVLSGSSHPELTAQIVERLGLKLSAASFKTYPNHETQVEIAESVRGQDVFIIQSGSDTVNDHLMELLIMVNACKFAAAARITAVLPYFPYSKHSKKKRLRGAITAKLVANMLAVAGVNHVITMDLHSSQIQGFFNRPVDNMFAEPSVAKYIREHVPNYQTGVVISKNAGGAKRVTSLADRLKIDFALMHKDTSGSSVEVPDISFPAERFMSLPPSKSNQSINIPVDAPPVVLPNGNHISTNAAISSPATSSTIATSPPIDPRDKLTLIGDVKGRTAFILDDIIDSSKSLIPAAKHLIKNNASKVYIIGTHGISSGSALKDLEECPYVHGIIVTNTYPLTHAKIQASKKLAIIDVSGVFAEAIRRTHNGESISYLFDVTV